MTLSTTTNTKSYTGDASTVAFAFPYLFYSNSDLVVTVDGAVKTIITDYNVTGAENDSGGTVTFTSAPSNGAVIIIQRIVDFLQNTDFENFDGNPADVTEKQFDLCVMMAQQNNEKAERAILSPLGTTLTNNEISGTIDTTQRLLVITSSGVSSALVGSLTDNLDVTLSGLANGDLLKYNGTNWENVTQASLGLLSNVVSDTTPQLGGTLDTNSKQVRFSKGADVASASALTLGTDGNYFDITGTTAITSIGTLAVGTTVKLHFDGALTLTHHATDLILPSGANITTAAGDEAEFVEYATGDWRCTNYSKADGTPIVSSSGGLVLLGSYTASNATSVDIGSGLDLDAAINGTYDEYLIIGSDCTPQTDSTNFYLRTSTDGGSTFDAGASNYRWCSVRRESNGTTVNGLASAGDTEIELITSAGIGNAAGESFNFNLRLHKPSGTNYTQVSFDSSFVQADGQIGYIQGTGMRESAADVDAIRLLMSSGNINGTFYLYGIRKS